uniref:Pericentriolar material 1 protein n=1 Tax=Rhipicephalus zambeziensis TaxID=60191 RepID=A0A224YI41_9ACAR
MQRRNTDPDQARRNARADRASPSTASVGSASSASKNTNRAHDTSALTSRLKHLDDCMRQVKSLMKNLEKSEDPMAQQQLVTLHQMLDQLNIEHANTDDRKGRFNALDLRQRHLNERLLETGGREASPASASGSLDNCLNSHPADDPQYAQLLQDEKESLMEQNAVIRKIIESQKKLSALREQHDIIRSVQKKAENKLAEAKAFQDQLAASNPDLSVWVSEMQRETAAGTLPMPPTSSLREAKRAAPSRRSHHGASAPPCDVACCGDGNWNWSADSAADGASAEALIGAIGGHPAGDVEFEQLERRVQQLQRLLGQEDKFDIADLESATVDGDATDLQASQITANIQALQEQKSQVDQLLRELSTLQTEACRLSIQSNPSAGIASEGSKGVSSVRGPTKFSTPFEQPSMKDKRRQVNEMRKTLQQLKSAVKNLDQGDLSGAGGNSSSALQEAPPKSRGSATYKKDNLQGDFPARRHYEAEGRANEEPDVGPGAAAAATVPVQPPADPTSAAQARANGDMLAEKVRQLQTTRSQLQYLQSLVASFQDGNTEPAASAQRSGVSSSGESDLRKEQQKQRHNLEQLQEQRLRLSLLRQQLASSQAPLAKNQLRVAPEGPAQHLPATSPRGSSADPALSPTKKDNVTLPKNLYDTTKASNRLHDNSSNLESLSRDKAILEELLQQERSKQLLSYSHNEDVRSPSSCSASSEPMEGMNFGTGSVMAGGNTTIAATWGGSSTQENLEDDEDDDEDRQEGSVEAGHDSEGSRSDVENDTGRSMPPPLAGKDHHHVSAEPAALPTKRADNRLTNTHASRVNGTCSGSSQWGLWHGAAGVIGSAPLQRQHSSGAQGDPSQAPPEVESLQSMPGVSALPMVPGWHQLSQHLLQQLENTNAMYQSILQEQQAFGTTAAAMSPGPQYRVPNTDVLHHYAIQQQLLLSIIHCYQLLSIQQMEISQLQQATHQQSCSPSVDDGLRGPSLQPLDQGSPFLAEPDSTGIWAHGMAAAALHAAGPQVHRPLVTAEARGAPPGATLNNQVVPGSRANNFWDNFRSYSRQNLLSNPGTVPKTNELPANFQVQQSHPSGPILTAASSRTKMWASPRDSRDCPPAFSSVGSSSQPSHVRPVQNVWPQESPGNRTNDSKQPNGIQGHMCGVEHAAEALNISPSRRPAPHQQQQQQQPACDVLKMSIGAEVSRLLEGKEDAASLAAVLHQLQLLNSPQPDLTSGQACGGARRKVPLSTKSNIPKENRAQNGDRHLMFQRGASESSPDLVASVEFANDSRSRIEETLSDSSFDKNIARPLAAVTARKRAKPLCSPASQPPQLSTMAAASMERTAPAEHMVAERDCGTNEDQAASARPIDPVFEQTWPEKDTTVSAPQAAELPQPGGEGPVAEPLPVLDNMLMMAEAHALRGVNQDVQQAMYNIELAFLQQGLAPGGEHQGEEAEDDEDRELETEPEAEGTQDLAEADQSPAAEQDANDQQPEDVAAPALLGAVGGAVGGAEGGVAEQPMDDAASRQPASDASEVSHEDAVPRTESEDDPPRQHEGSQPPPS